MQVFLGTQCRLVAWVERWFNSPASSSVLGRTCVPKPQKWGRLSSPDPTRLGFKLFLLFSVEPRPCVLCLSPRARGQCRVLGTNRFLVPLPAADGFCLISGIQTCYLSPYDSQPYLNLMQRDSSRFCCFHLGNRHMSPPGTGFSLKRLAVSLMFLVNTWWETIEMSCRLVVDFLHGEIFPGF